MPEETTAHPFDGLEEAFTADLEPRRHEFEMHGRTCFVAVRVLDAIADERFQRKLTRSLAAARESIKELAPAINAEGGAAADVDPTAALSFLDQMGGEELQVDLLLAAVADFELARKKRGKGSDSDQWTVEVVKGATLSESQRRALFRGELDLKLTPRFHQALVRLCCEVNQVDPFLVLGRAAAVSAPPSTDSEATSPES